MSSIALERRAMKIGWPPQLITICAPSARAPMSWLTGAPAKRARALVLQDLMKGTAANPAPTAPTTAVVAVRNLRRPVLTSSLAIPHSEKNPNTLRWLRGALARAGCRKRRGSVTERLTGRQSAAVRNSAGGGQISPVTVGQHAHALHVALGFLVRRHAVVLVHRALAGVVAGRRQGQVAVEALQQPRQVFHPALDVLLRVEGVADPEPARGGGHQLHQALCADARQRRRV